MERDWLKLVVCLAAESMCAGNFEDLLAELGFRTRDDFDEKAVEKALAKHIARQMVK